MKISTHKELAAHIIGRPVLHLDSLGKDSVLALHWLATFAEPSKIVSVNFRLPAPHPDDDRYMAYLKKRYPAVQFVVEPSPTDLTRQCYGEYQSPIEVMKWIADLEYDTFDFRLTYQALKKEHGCEFICLGHSKYESFRRAQTFHQKGVLIKDEIYPLGMMSKRQVIDLLKASGTKLHPLYRFSSATMDHPSWFKYARSFRAYPEFQAKMFEQFPLLALDKYRWETLFNKRLYGSRN